MTDNLRFFEKDSKRIIPFYLIDKYCTGVQTNTPPATQVNDFMQVIDGNSCFNIPNPLTNHNPAYYLPDGPRTLDDVTAGAIRSHRRLLYSIITSDIPEVRQEITTHGGPETFRNSLFAMAVNNMTLVSPNNFGNIIYHLVNNACREPREPAIPETNLIICTPNSANPDSSGSLIFDTCIERTITLPANNVTAQPWELNSNNADLRFLSRRIGNHTKIIASPSKLGSFNLLKPTLAPILNNSINKLTLLTDSIQSGNEACLALNFGLEGISEISDPDLTIEINTAYYNPGNLASYLESIAEGLFGKGLNSLSLSINAIRSTKSWRDVNAPFSLGFPPCGLIGSIRGIGQSNYAAPNIAYPELRNPFRGTGFDDALLLKKTHALIIAALHLKAQEKPESPYL